MDDVSAVVALFVMGYFAELLFRAVVGHTPRVHGRDTFEGWDK